MTKTHLLTFYIFWKESTFETLLMACPFSSLDQSPDDAKPALQVSHCVVMKDLAFTNLHLMCETLANSGTPHLTLVGRRLSQSPQEESHLSTLRLVLDPDVGGSGGGLGSITYRYADYMSLPGGQSMWLDTGPDECARGVHGTADGSIVLFSLAANEHGRLQCHYSVPLPIPEDLVKQSVVAFDGRRGVLCVKVTNMARNVRLEIRRASR